LFQRDDPADFALPGDEEKIAQATEPSQEEESQTVETSVDTAPEERPRDEKGRFVSEETEVEAVEETPEEEVPEEPELLAGKFKSPEELAAAYEEIQSYAGRLGSELGELRQLVQQPQQAQPQVLDQAALASLIDERPDLATELAYQSGNQAALQIAFQAFSEEDETAAKLWATEKRVERMQAQFEQSQTQMTQSVQSREYESALETFAKDHPDIDEHAGRMQEIAREHPFLADVLQSDNPKAKLDVFEFLYNKARGRASENLDEAARAVAREHAEQTQQVKREGILATSTASIPEAKPSIADEIADEWDKQNAPYKSGPGGWNI
jgi:hypothetical protein